MARRPRSPALPACLPGESKHIRGRSRIDQTHDPGPANLGTVRTITPPTCAGTFPVDELAPTEKQRRLLGEARASYCDWTRTAPFIHGCGEQMKLNSPGLSNATDAESPGCTTPVSKAKLGAVAVCG